MNVSDIMISPVVVTQKNKTVKHVRELLDRKKINAIPVLTMEGEIEGIVTVSDIAAESNNDNLVENIMTTKTHVVSINSGLQDAAKMMEKHHVHHLVAMDNGQVVGILSSMDFVKLYANN
ncbi:MAG: CBS domain-containing protein [Vicingaceae bacterium]|nr:CBS domain-containing protein [Vicingaceae bacterium]